MIQVEKDIEAALKIARGYKVESKEYNRVRLFTNRSLKYFRKCAKNINEEDILTKYNSPDDVIDLLSYGANVTCYSTNRLDEYFLKFKLAFLIKEYDEFFEYFFKDYSNKGYNTLTKNGYISIRGQLEEKERYFFDELFRSIPNIMNSMLILRRNVRYSSINGFVRYFIENRYNEAKKYLDSRNINFILSNDENICKNDLVKDKQFKAINLSYNIDHMDEEKIKFIMTKIDENFKKFLMEYGKIFCFVGTSGVDLEGLTKFETKSMLPDNKTQEAKTQYTYIYKNSLTNI